MATYYPLAVRNSWTYKNKDGSTFTNSVLSQDGNTFTMNNSLLGKPQYVRKDGDTFLADNFEAGNFQVLLKDNAKAGDAWEVKYKANNFDNILYMTVKEVGSQKEVEGKVYNNVMLIEGDLKINMNGTLTSLNYLVQYYYTLDIGLILTTSSYGDAMGLTAYQLK
jgi:hypothetical protein